MRKAYHHIRKDTKAGIDSVTAGEYEQGLEENLRSLLNRLKSGTYYAPAVKRALFVEQVKRSWRKWLDRRNRERHMNWERFSRLLQRYPLPKARIVHSL